MDLLFKRYASPFSFMDGMISTGRFSEFVESVLRTANKEREETTEWEYFLHKVFGTSFAEFKEGIKINTDNQKMSERTIETTVKNSLSILKNFNPD